MVKFFLLLAVADVLTLMAGKATPGYQTYSFIVHCVITVISIVIALDVKHSIGDSSGGRQYTIRYWFIILFVPPLIGIVNVFITRPAEIFAAQIHFATILAGAFMGMYYLLGIWTLILSSYRTLEYRLR